MRQLAFFFMILLSSNVFCQHVIGVSRNDYFGSLSRNELSEFTNDENAIRYGFLYNYSINGYVVALSVDYHQNIQLIDDSPKDFINHIRMNNLVINLGPKFTIWKDIKLETGISGRINFIKGVHYQPRMINTPIFPNSDQIMEEEIKKFNLGIYQQITYQPVIYNNFGLLISVNFTSYLTPFSQDNYSSKSLDESAKFYTSLGIYYSFFE